MIAFPSKNVYLFSFKTTIGYMRLLLAPPAGGCYLVSITGGMPGGRNWLATLETRIMMKPRANWTLGSRRTF